MEKRVLGRGLNALIPEKTQVQPTEEINSRIVLNIPVDRIITNKYQPRSEFDEEGLKNLTMSIKEKGIIQPIIVRHKPDKGEYELIAGERRLKAAKRIELKEIPAIVKEASDIDSLELSIIENVQRQDLNPIEQASAYKRLIEEFHLTQEQVADVIGKDRATVANILRLLKLPVKIREYVSRGTITMGHARAILTMEKEQEQLRLCTKIIKNDLSVRDTERYARKISSRTTKKISKSEDPDIMQIESELRDILGTKVSISKSRKGGKIEIEFYSQEELEKLVTYLKSRR